MVNLVAVGWVVFGTAVVRREESAWERPGLRWSLLALIVLLAVFQVALRPGVRF